jgi:hypothetical protein
MADDRPFAARQLTGAVAALVDFVAARRHRHLTADELLTLDRLDAEVAGRAMAAGVPMPPPARGVVPGSGYTSYTAFRGPYLVDLGRPTVLLARRGTWDARMAALKTAAETIANATGKNAVVAEEIVYRGESAYSVGDRSESLTTPEHCTLQPFLTCPAMAEKTLIDRSGYASAARILRAIRNRYDGIFAPYIVCPSTRSSGGYKVLIRDGTRRER